MCRMLCYLGPPATLAELIVDPPRGLAEQAYAPKYQTHGTMNADGFGAGWYDPSRSDEPARYRRAIPLWNDRTFESIARLVASGAVLAAVRSATPPLPVHEANTPPYQSGRWLFAHNGAIDGFAGPLAEDLRRAVSPSRAAAMEGSTDSEVLFAMMLAAMDDGASPSEAMAGAARTAEAIAGGGRLTMLATDGERVTGLTWGDSMFVREEPDAVTVASEPSGDAAEWHRLPDRVIIEAAPGAVRTIPLDASADKESA